MMDIVTVVVPCPICGKESSVEVLREDLIAWHCGMLAQDAFPYLSADDRELLISGICEECWENPWSCCDDEPSYNEDEGFDPYCGEYTFDCQEVPMLDKFKDYCEMEYNDTVSYLSKKLSFITPNEIITGAIQRCLGVAFFLGYDDSIADEVDEIYEEYHQKFLDLKK